MTVGILTFQRVADQRSSQWPDPARSRQFHLDFGVADLNRAQEQCRPGGARVLDDGADGRCRRVRADPADIRSAWYAAESLATPTPTHARPRPPLLLPER
ncbi:VOC family protein [Streptomyces cynarae]|uniref:VOC family protein n=1 Tax=Streptomyces cynarae TaxID=2981134 RepID=UPI00406C0E4F